MEADHEREEWGRAGEAAVSARRLHDRGMTYRQIGEELGLSKSKAHSLVKEARFECTVKAERIPRGPSRERASDEESALELLRRLRQDYSLLEGQALDHLDADGLTSERAAFGEATARVEVLIRSGRGKEKGLAAALQEATAAFHAVLGAAAAYCEEFARRIGTGRSAETFAADAVALGRMISPRTTIGLPPWQDDATLAPVGRAPRRLDKAARIERDLEIFMASVNGETQREIAARFEIGERQVRNIVRGQRDGATFSRAEEARMRSALARRTSAWIERLGSSPSQSLPRAREDLVLMLRALAEVRGAPTGDGPPAGPLLVSREGCSPEVTRRLNLSIRRRLEEAEVPDEVIDDVTELVLRNILADGDEEMSTA